MGGRFPNLWLHHQGAENSLRNRQCGNGYRPSHRGRASRSDAIHEFRNLSRESILRCWGFILDLDQGAKNILLELLDIGTRLPSPINRRSPKKKSRRRGVRRHLARSKIDVQTTSCRPDGRPAASRRMNAAG